MAGALSAVESSAQTGPANVPEDVTPPPVKYVPADLSAQLAQAKDRKARLKLTIEMSERRLTNAATFTASATVHAGVPAVARDASEGWWRGKDSNLRSRWGDRFTVCCV